MKDNYFGKKLKELRLEKGLSQKELGKIFNVCNQTVSFWETGSREPDFDTLKNLAAIFDVTINDFLGLNVD